MRDPTIDLVADMRTSYENGGDVALLLDRVGEVGPISFGGVRALVDFLKEVGTDLPDEHPEAVLGVLDEVEDAVQL